MTGYPPQTSPELADARRRGRAVLAGWFLGAGLVWLLLLVCLGLGIAAASRSGDGGTVVSSVPGLSSDHVSVTGDGANQTFTVRAADAVITGDHNTITLHGDCRTVSVTGDANVVRMDRAGSVSLTGDGNRAFWNSGPAPGLIESGDGNRLTHGSD